MTLLQLAHIEGILAAYGYFDEALTIHDLWVKYRLLLKKRKSAGK